jgi:hypothetical protein
MPLPIRVRCTQISCLWDVWFSLLTLWPFLRAFFQMTSDKYAGTHFTLLEIVRCSSSRSIPPCARSYWPRTSLARLSVRMTRFSRISYPLLPISLAYWSLTDIAIQSDFPSIARLRGYSRFSSTFFSVPPPSAPFMLSSHPRPITLESQSSPRVNSCLRGCCTRRLSCYHGFSFDAIQGFLIVWKTPLHWWNLRELAYLKFCWYLMWVHINRNT